MVFSNLTTGVSVTPANSSVTITSSEIYNDDEVFFMLQGNGINVGNKNLQIDPNCRFGDSSARSTSSGND